MCEVEFWEVFFNGKNEGFYSGALYPLVVCQIVDLGIETNLRFFSSRREMAKPFTRTALFPIRESSTLRLTQIRITIL